MRLYGMPTSISVKNMSEYEWLEERNKGVGGSDASIVLGLNKYKSAFQLWHEKTGKTQLEQLDNEAIHWGNILEDVVAKEFERVTGKKVRKDNHMYSHSEYPFMRANLDRVVVGERAILECKTANSRLSEAWKDDEIPSAYFLQVQHYLAVMEYEKAYIAVLIGGQKFVWKEIKRDEELIQMIISAESKFWNDHVLKDIAPEIDGSDAASKYLSERFADTDDTTKELSIDYEKDIAYRDDLKRNIKELQKEERLIENKLKVALGTSEVGISGKYRIKWTPITTGRVDSQRLKEEKPEVYQAFLKETQSRRLNIKEIG